MPKAFLEVSEVTLSVMSFGTLFCVSTGPTDDYGLSVKNFFFQNKLKKTIKLHFRLILCIENVMCELSIFPIDNNGESIYAQSAYGQIQLFLN